jgi:hypothetical protein
MASGETDRRLNAASQKTHLYGLSAESERPISILSTALAGRDIRVALCRCRCFRHWNFAEHAPQTKTSPGEVIVVGIGIGIGIGRCEVGLIAGGMRFTSERCKEAEEHAS